MYEYVLIVQLMTNGPRVEMPAHDCTIMASWVIEARRWAERSGLEPSEKAVCYPADSPVLIRVRSE